MNKLRELDEKWHSSQTELEKLKSKNATLETERKSTENKVRKLIGSYRHCSYILSTVIICSFKKRKRSCKWN